MSVSASFQVKELLLTLDEGTSVNSLVLANRLDATVGAVSGTLSRLCRHGVLTLVSTGKPFEYVLSDKELLKTIKFSKTAAVGSRPGRSDNGRKFAKIVSTKTISDQLLDIAASLEHLTPDLTLVSTEALLAELKRRTSH